MPTAEDAVRLIPKACPDVVLMDIHLPGRSGIECTRKLKCLCPATHIVILTVYSDDDAIFDALRAGASGYLLKRASPSEILASIQDVLGGGAPMSSQIAMRVIRAFHEPAAADAPHSCLSEREQEILRLLAKGYATKEIAARISVSVNTIRTHLQHIYQKLHVRSRTEAIIKYFESRP